MARHPADFHVSVTRLPRFKCSFCGAEAFALAEPARGGAIVACDEHLAALHERIGVELGIPREAAAAGRRAVEQWAG